MTKQAPDTIDLLDADHLAVHAMLQSYRELVRMRAGALQRRALAEEICMELTIHARLEEELLYPALQRTGVQAYQVAIGQKHGVHCEVVGIQQVDGVRRLLHHGRDTLEMRPARCVSQRPPRM